MARIRSLKPQFFKHPELAELPVEARLFFAGLWCQADREGRLKDRPRFLKVEIAPYDDLDVNEVLNLLARAKFIVRYTVCSEPYIAIPRFLKHQKPHPREPPSEIPPLEQADPAKPDLDPARQDPAVKKNGQAMPGPVVSGSLVSGSLVSGSLVSGFLGSGEKQKTAQRALAKAARVSLAPSKSGPCWDAYRTAYERRYGAPPVRNARTNRKLCDLVDILGARDAPEVAAFYVGHNGSDYVKKLHQVWLLVANAEALRTEWATGRRMTATESRQLDRTQANFDGWTELLSKRPTNVV